MSFIKLMILTCTILTISSSQAFARGEDCTLDLNGFDELAKPFKNKNYKIISVNEEAEYYLEDYYFQCLQEYNSDRPILREGFISSESRSLSTVHSNNLDYPSRNTAPESKCYAVVGNVTIVKADTGERIKVQGSSSARFFGASFRKANVDLLKNINRCKSN